MRNALMQLFRSFGFHDHAQQHSESLDAAEEQATRVLEVEERRNDFASRKSSAAAMRIQTTAERAVQHIRQSRGR